MEAEGRSETMSQISGSPAIWNASLDRELKAALHQGRLPRVLNPMKFLVIKEAHK